ncbi:hypothetical protein SOVF_136460 [Spinacia oleracea]|uniref:Uncharacterized protein n=1 Tax=Spinacia oleracea TaxID=3562 RepID=A0A9R0JX16_SPIOL|nr:uncharacterized protein LOC110789866 [Spinacia oleracea]KNA11310.1 hypothetical protein SOVF_136460 [Spinacia oleracea]
MSTSSRSDTTDDSIFDLEELLHIEARCRELRKEKDLLKETQFQSFDLIKRLELHVRKLNDARLEDKRKIQDLEKELNNCHQEIDYLQDQLNERNADVNYLEDHVGSFEIKMAEFDLLQEEVISLREEMEKSNSECEFLIQELDKKETQLQQSRFHIEKLEESIASTALEYQCEIESLRLEMMSLEHNCFDSENSEEYCQETSGLTESTGEFQTQFQDAQTNIENLEKENKRMKLMLNAHEKESRLFFRIEEVEVGGSAEKMSHELYEYKTLAKQLKEELRAEKLRAKEETEDLAQEMAELRYQMTELLEEERKRRSCIEKASLQRITELETQLRMEERKSVIGPVQRIREA